ncbi:pentatricopeptide repeat-containing protein At2g42920, chloroplastic-like [Wolffia australiana]
MFSLGVKIPYTLNLPPPPDHLPHLHQCSNLREARQVHAAMAKSGQASDPLSAAKLLEFYALSMPNSPSCAEKLALSLNWPISSATFAFNTAMRAHLRSEDPLKCTHLFLCLLHYPEFSPDSFTLTIALKAATLLPSPLPFGRQLHSQIVRRRLAATAHVSNKLVHFYSVAGDMGSAQKVFDEILSSDASQLAAAHVSNKLVHFNCVAGHMGSAQKVFDESPSPDAAQLAVAQNSLLRGYAAAGDGAGLRRAFTETLAPDVVAWNTVIGFLAGAGEHVAAVAAFREMQLSGVAPDRVSLIATLAAAGHLAALGLGRWVHAYALRRGIELDSNLVSAVIAMYARCGCVEDAAAVFAATPPQVRRKADVWNAMITALVGGGFSDEALRLFTAMEAARVRPDAITFAGVLSACGHGGLVERGEELFDRMGEFYGVEPDIGHYGVMIDLWCRAGQLEKAEEMIRRMPVAPDAAVWRTVLWACRRHGTRFLELGMEAGKRLLELEPEEHAGYVLFSNLMAMAGRWREVTAVRKEMKRRKMRKVPGCSSIELDGTVHEFIAGD